MKLIGVLVNTGILFTFGCGKSYSVDLIVFSPTSKTHVACCTIYREDSPYQSIEKHRYLIKADGCCPVIQHTVGIQSTRHTAAGWLLATSPLRNLPPPPQKKKNGTPPMVMFPTSPRSFKKRSTSSRNWSLVIFAMAIFLRSESER